jgi:hypothetical protein
MKVHCEQFLFVFERNWWCCGEVEDVLLTKFNFIKKIFVSWKISYSDDSDVCITIESIIFRMDENSGSSSCHSTSRWRIEENITSNYAEPLGMNNFKSWIEDATCGCENLIRKKLYKSKKFPKNLTWRSSMTLPPQKSLGVWIITLAENWPHNVFAPPTTCGKMSASFA